MIKKVRVLQSSNFLLVPVLLLIGNGLVCAQEPAAVVLRTESSGLAIYQDSDHSWEPFFSSRSYLNEVKVSPDGQNVAFLETRSCAGNPGGDLVNVPCRYLVVVNVATRQRQTLDNVEVYRYAWCCDGETIAAITGTWREGGIGFTPHAVVLFRPDSGMIELAPSQTAASDAFGHMYDVAWSQGLRTLFLKSGRPLNGSTIFGLNLLSHELEPTRHKDLRFSPSGQFYLWVPPVGAEDSRIRLMRTSDDTEIPLPGAELGAVDGWAYDRGDFLLLVRTRASERRVRALSTGGAVWTAVQEPAGYAVFDVISQRVESSSADIVAPGVYHDRAVLPLITDGKLRITRLRQ